jgi:hypothetical protein
MSRKHHVDRLVRLAYLSGLLRASLNCPRLKPKRWHVRFERYVRLERALSTARIRATFNPNYNPNEAP